MEIKKIARLEYRRARQGELLAFTDNVYRLMKASDDYAPLAARIDALTMPLEQYRASLLAARNRGISQVLAKNIARNVLIPYIDDTATDLEIFAKGNIQLIINAGFSIQQNSGPRFKGILPAPEIVRVYSTGKKGELRVILSDAFPNAVRTHAIEFSFDGAVNWKNGEYHNARSFVITGLPRVDNILMHVRSIGNGFNKSEWSEPVSVTVL